MIHLYEILDRTNCNITEGSDYLWPCFGPRARGLDFLHTDSDGTEINVYAVFDQLTKQVYELDFSIYEGDSCYSRVWVDPEYRKAYKKEVKKREKELGYKLDNGKMIKSQNKILSIINNKYPKYYVLSSMDLELDDDVWDGLARAAHARNITVNSLVHEALTTLAAEKKWDISQPASNCTPAATS